MPYTIESLVAPVFEELIQLIASFTPENFNKIPFESSWTAGQVVQHIRLSAGNLPHVLNGATAATDRQPDEKIGALRDTFMDFGTKFNSPDFILPQKKDYDQDRFVDFFNKLNAEIAQAMEELDLSETCTDSEIPGFGQLTRVEWIAFVVYHTQRHIHQLRNISQKV